MILIGLDGVTEVEVYASWVGGMVDTYVRSTDRALFDTDMEQFGLLYPDGDGGLVPGKGVNISHLGPIHDSEGTLIDARHHANIRLTGYALERMDDLTERPLWEVVLLTAMLSGSDDTQINNTEQGKRLSDTVLIDPASFTPKRVWA
ncbi:hypothetical protein [Mameliella alba]|uniref:Uncharacterized protein n=1 Tax=Mameliella alba TaxID=561184 RepID=A0A0B3RSV1_9RHOB|nr:hypothetical protein [Mameliella alba]KHQ51082.1 hypothetical protein OA50_04453 [Mameliella alba]